ncbi:AraC family transcriptional regulator [Methylobacterium sp. PvR107]|uniref:AraC family transcriptional regulator n=1 Tax=Methylobacterium sp. PvR107 TaxID=2806597 RepID=UPI001AE32DF5|nr:AraC family transcriptional regulator [Methylobacterium sp. PvR107]MBP1179239.1 AraC-like DNA-binding protein [Methylobacterium sp. PvR107]
MLRIGIAEAIAAVLPNLGVDLDDEIRSASQAVGENDAPSRALPELSRLISLCVARTNCPHFGLLVGQRDMFASLGLMGALMPQSSTVGQILTKLVCNLHSEDATTVPMLTQHGETARLSYAIDRYGIESADQITDGALATGVNILRMLRGFEWSPSEVLLPHPPPTDLGPFARFFRAPIRFDAGTAGLVFPASCLEQQIVAEAVLRRLFADRLGPPTAVAADSFGEEVRRVLRARLPSDGCSAKAIAPLFSMHRRTLSRHLRREGLSFSTLVNEIRFEIARRLLTQTDMTFTQVARVLGFAEISVFTRAFRRWSGQTPTAWRAAHRPG